MPVVAQIRTREKAKGFFDVQLVDPDGDEQLIIVHEDVLVHEELYKGKELTAQETANLKKASEGIRAYHAALHFLSFRMRSEHEMRLYLKKKDFLPEQINRAIERLTADKLLDDRAFAASFVRTRLELSSKGPQLIYRELLQAGIDQTIAQQSVEFYPSDLQIENARKYLMKQTVSIKNRKSAVESRQILSRQLMQRGFSQEVSQQVIQEISDFLVDNEKSARIYQMEKALQKFKKLSGDELLRKVKAYLYRKGFPTDQIALLLEERIRTIGDD
ncbi:MAG: RecX family transcriptional regulator [Sporolactobacillus sp.]